MKIKIATYNLHKGVSYLSRNFLLQEMKDSIVKIDVDMLFVQEIMGIMTNPKFPDFHGENQLELMADQVWKHFAYGKNAIHQRGNHGNAILSRFPIITHENIDISTNRFEKRGILHGVVAIPNNQGEETTKLHLLCLHLNLLDSGRQVQLSRLIDRVNEVIPKNEPMIIAGDFNDWRHLASRRLMSEINVSEAHMERHGEFAKTFPSFFPVVSLDRVFYRGLTLEDAFVLNELHWRRLSDHLGLSAEFSL